MSRAKIRKTLHSKIDEQFVAAQVSKGLRRAYTELTTAIKWIERITGVKAQTASKWYRGVNAPNSAHLLRLASHYPEILEAICSMADRRDVWHASSRYDVPQTMRTAILESHPNHRFRGDKFVTPKGRSDSQIRVQFNQRQIWFLEQLQQGAKLQTKDIAIAWNVHIRTAKRDIAGLSSTKWVKFVSQGNSGWYSIT